MAEQINTADEVIDRLGGPTEVSRLIGVSIQAVTNWRTRGLPPETFVVLTTELNKKSLYAPPALWRMREAVA
jgi:hypothetical protein